MGGVKGVEGDSSSINWNTILGTFGRGPIY